MRGRQKVLDVLLNIVANATLVGTVQLLAYPYLSRQMSAADYGVVLLAMAVVNTAAVSFGGGLNNTRLVRQRRPTEAKDADYNVIFLGTLIVVVALVAVACSTIMNSVVEILLCGVVAALTMFRTYFSVSFRIVISYRKTLEMSVCGAAGVIIGTGIASLIGLWPVVFLAGETAACMYLAFRAPEVREKLALSEHFWTSTRAYLALTAAALITSAMAYLDRLVLFPVLGPEDVATFTIASYVGKMVGLLLTPIASVVLTYYARQAALNVLDFLKQTGFAVLTCAALFTMTVLWAPAFNQLLYPDLAAYAQRYIVPANLGAIIFLLGSFINAALIRFCSSAWVLVNQVSYVLLYVIAALCGIWQGGLAGFCWAVVFANTARFIITMSIILLAQGKQKVPALALRS